MASPGAWGPGEPPPAGGGDTTTKIRPLPRPPGVSPPLSTRMVKHTSSSDRSLLGGGADTESKAKPAPSADTSLLDADSKVSELFAEVEDGAESPSKRLAPVHTEDASSPRMLAGRRPSRGVEAMEPILSPGWDKKPHPQSTRGRFVFSDGDSGPGLLNTLTSAGSSGSKESPPSSRSPSPGVGAPPTDADLPPPAAAGDSQPVGTLPPLSPPATTPLDTAKENFVSEVTVVSLPTSPVAGVGPARLASSPLLDVLPSPPVRSTSDNGQSLSPTSVVAPLSSPGAPTVANPEDSKTRFRAGSSSVLKTSAMTVHVDEEGDTVEALPVAGDMAVKFTRAHSASLHVRRGRTASLGGAARLSIDGINTSARQRSRSELGALFLAPNRHPTPPPPPPKPPLSHRARVATLHLLRSSRFAMVIGLAIVWALFADDVRLAWFSRGADPVFYSVSCVVLTLFVLELVGNIWCRPHFVFGFYFWLDLLSAVSLIPDVGWLWEAFTGHEDARATGGNAQELRAGRAARVGTRAGRIVRIVRLVRLARMVDIVRQVRRRAAVLEKQALAKRDRASSNDDPSKDNSTGPSGATPNPLDVPQEPDRPTQKMYISRLGRVLADMTTRRIILLVLVIVLLLPLLDPSFSLDLSDDFRFNGLENCHEFAQDAALPPSVFESHVRKYGAQSGALLFVSVCPPGSDCVTQHTAEELRNIILAAGDGEDFLVDVNSVEEAVNAIDCEFRESEFESYTVSGCLDASGAAIAGDCVSRSFVSVRHLAQKDALFSLFKTLFVIVIIVLAAMLFTRDAEVLVIRPIERMTALVVELARNPLKSINSIRRSIRQQYGADDSSRRPRLLTGRGSDWIHGQAGKEGSSGSGTLRRSFRGTFIKRGSSTMGDDEDSPQAFLNEENFETVLVENAMAKIGGLLQIGFGEAGGAIIANNMRHKGRLDCLIPGVKVDAVFGFCDIRQFTDVTECLQEEVMVFVNQIGQIVHSAVHRLGGAANKNIGDAFLLVWKLPQVSKSHAARSRQNSHTESFTPGRRRSDGKRRSQVMPAPDGPRALESKPGLGTVSSTSATLSTTRRRSSFMAAPDTGRARVKSVNSATPLTVQTEVSPRHRVASAGSSIAHGLGAGAAPHRLKGSPLGDNPRRFSAASSPPAPALSPPAVPALSPPAAPVPAVSGAPSPPGVPPASAPPAASPGASQAGTPTIGDAMSRVSRGLLSVPSTGSVRSTPKRLDSAVSKPAKITRLSSMARSPSFRWSGQKVSLYGNSPTQSNASSRRESAASLTRANSAGEAVKAPLLSQATTPPHFMPKTTGSSTMSSGMTRGDTVTTVDIRVNGASSSPGGTPKHSEPAGAGAPSGGRRRSSSWVAHDRRPSVVGGETAVSGFLNGRSRVAVAKIADDALCAFIKVLVDIYNSNHTGRLKVYTRHRLLRQRFPDRWYVQLGFGMHIGWAIEGAIGSTYKIDASYLSPHVNIASRLEAATKRYRVPIIISSTFATQLSVSAQRFLRLIDRVTLKGSVEPMELYTFDVDWGNMPASLGEDPDNVCLAHKHEDPEPRIAIDFATDENLNMLQSELPLSFFEAAEAGVEAYIEGEWDEARIHLQAVLADRPDDGPVLEVLRFIGDRAAPPDWPGFRVLDSK